MNEPRTRCQRLIEDIEARGYFVEEAQLPQTKSVTVEVCGRQVIGVDPSLESDQRFDALAHELGHAAYGGCYYRSDPFDLKSRHEARADKWAFYYFLPPAVLLDACRTGTASAEEIADRFDLSPSFVRRAVEYYHLIGVFNS